MANEGEPDDGIDPEGSISIIDLSAGVGNATVATADFTGFNGQLAALQAAGVRIFGQDGTPESVAQDLEPEFITVSADGATAYVALQENNALAVVDIANGDCDRHFAPGSPRPQPCGQWLGSQRRGWRHQYCQLPGLWSAPAGRNCLLRGRRTNLHRDG